jgi:hypothetical protein
MPGAEKRRNRRFKMAVPVQVRPKRTAPPIETSTIDVSATGLYFTLPHTLEIGVEVECEIMLPPMFGGSTVPVPVRCVGKIVRVERSDPSGRVGIAVNIDKYEFAADKARQPGIASKQ